jgi:two-component system LytT family response regulator
MYSVLIIDDEPLARRELANILRSRSDIAQLQQAEDASSALEALAQTQVDVVFLDINMPEISGIELLELCQEKQIPFPAVVFVTAHSEYALTAFEHHAVDYVLKPFSAARIHKALDNAIRRSEAERMAKLLDAIPDLQMLHHNQPRRIAMKVQGRILFLNPSDILFVQAEGNYVLLQGANGSHLLRESMNQVEQKLVRHGFVRIHRSIIVNSMFVREFRPCYTGEYSLTLTNGKEFTVTRTYKKNLRNLATDIIGADAPAAEEADQA